MRLIATNVAHMYIQAAYPLYLSLLSVRRPINVLVASPNAFAA